MFQAGSESDFIIFEVYKGYLGNGEEKELEKPRIEGK